jgi:hypothetical protein
MKDRNKQLKSHEELGMLAIVPHKTIRWLSCAAHHRPSSHLRDYQRASAAPQVNPPPMASMRIKLPSRTRWSSKA